MQVALSAVAYERQSKALFVRFSAMLRHTSIRYTLDDGLTATVTTPLVSVRSLNGFYQRKKKTHHVRRVR